MTELSERARRVLALARHEDDPDVGAAARVERSLSKRMALGAAIATGSAAVSKSAVGAGLLATAGKSALVAGVATTLAFTGWEALYSKPSAPEGSPAAVAAPSSGPPLVAVPPLGALSPRPSATSPNSSVAMERGNAASPAPSVRSPLPVSAPKVPRSTPPRTVSTRTGYPRDQPEPIPAAIAAETLAPPASDRLAIEARELRGAQQALRAGDNERALALLEQQDARHASGALAQERQAARVLALCQSQQVALARREAERFEARFPESPLLGKVRGACRGR